MDVTAGAGAGAGTGAGADEEPLAPTHAEFKAALDVALKEAQAMAQAGNLEGACGVMLSHEKKTRLAGDAFATAEAAVALVELLWASGDLKTLNAHILILAKRRSQLKKVITNMVQAMMAHVDEVSDEDARVELITTLRTVADGKIYVEVERARLTMKLAMILEKRGKIQEASETLQEVAVETYGSMDKREKADFLMEQIRLCLAQRDFVRMQIISNKVSKKVLDEDGFEDVKLKFYNLLIQLHTHHRNSAALRGDYQAMYTTTGVQDDAAQWQPALASVVVHLALSAHGTETSDMAHRLLRDKKLHDLPVYKRLLEHLTTMEVIPWPLPDDAELRAHPVLAEDEWYTMLHKRIVQHNIRVIAKYYGRIRFDRLCTLLSLDAKSTEAQLSEMVSEKFVYAKIDRPAGVVSFTRKKPAEEVLADWSADVSTLLGLVETTCRLINKENMLHGIATS